jgi:hypothetical protein
MTCRLAQTRSGWPERKVFRQPSDAAAQKLGNSFIWNLAKG